MRKTDNLPGGLSFHPVTITIEKAKDLLTANTVNRPVNLPLVERYASNMRKDLWQDFASTIHLNGKALIDGQHRLLAQIESNTVQHYFMVEGIGNEIMDVIDGGSKRTDQQRFRMRGYEYSDVLSPTLGYLTGYLEHQLISSLHSSYTEKVLLLEAHPGVSEYVAAYSIPLQLPLRKALLAAFAYLFSLKNKEESDDFMRGIITGENLLIGDPRLAFRNYLLRIEKPRSMFGTRQAGIALIRMWNAFRAGDKIHYLKMSNEIPEID